MPNPTDFSRAPEAAVFAALETLALPYANTVHAPVATVAESAAVKTNIAGAHTKNLFMKDKTGRLVLISAHAESKLPLNQLHKVLGLQRLSFGDPALMWETLGVTPGSVTGFSVMNDEAGRVQFVTDGALYAHDTWNFHPLRNDMTVSIAAADFLAFARAMRHDPRRVDFDQLDQT